MANIRIGQAGTRCRCAAVVLELLGRTIIGGRLAFGGGPLTAPRFDLQS